jgi:uncharacterized protein YjbI with pentapeptide repeats
MAESPKDHEAVVGVLSAFVRTHTLLPAEMRLLRQPLGRREPKDKEAPIFGTEPAADIDAAMTALARRPARDEPNRPDLRAVSLIGISLRGYDFAKVPRLTRIFFTGSDLRCADFREADLSGTIANYADLRWASFSNAKMRGTALRSCQLRFADMDGADLARALLTDADLREVTGLTARQLSVAAIDEDTLFSPDLKEDPWVKARLADCMAATKLPRPPRCPPPTPAPPS